MSAQQDKINRLYTTPEKLIDHRRQEFPEDKDITQLNSYLEENTSIENTLELGSGTGYVAGKVVQHFPDRPLRITGLDFLERYVEYATTQAEENGLADRLKFIQGDMRNFTFSKGEYDLIYSLWSSVAQINPDEQQALLNNLSERMNPGQVVYLDVMDWDNTEPFEISKESRTEQLEKDHDGGYVLTWTIKDGNQVKFFFHSKERWEEIFQEAGLNIEMRPYETSVCGLYRNRMAIIGTKR